MRLGPKDAYVVTQGFGVGALILMGIALTQTNWREPLTFLPVIVLYLWTQVGFRLGLRRTQRARRKRNLVFVV